MNSIYDIVLRDHFPVIPTARDVDYSSRRRYVCLSWQTVGRSLARRHVVDGRIGCGHIERSIY